MKANLTMSTLAPAPTPERNARQVTVAANDLYRVTIGLTALAYHRLETLRVEREEVSIADIARNACRLKDRISRAAKAGRIICLMNPDGQTITLDAYLAQMPMASSTPGGGERARGNQIRRLTFGLTQAGYQRLQALIDESEMTFADFVRDALRTLDRVHEAEKAGWVAVFVDPTRKADLPQLIALAP